MPGLWRDEKGNRIEKYLVVRRDGTIPEWPYFVLAASDRAAPLALHAYANAAGMYGMDYVYSQDIRLLAAQFVGWRNANTTGNPDAPMHRIDNPEVIAKMRKH